MACTSACRDAFGSVCTCNCAGANHGTTTPGAVQLRLFDRVQREEWLCETHGIVASREGKCHCGKELRRLQ